MKQQKGITLIALVVTVVVLLILAAISINIAFGNNGIFKQAQMAAGSTANAIDYEANTLGQQMEDFIANSVGSIGNQTPNPEPPEKNYEDYLVDKVNVGDYVAYNAGTWDSTVANPTSNASFGGYTEGQNKGTSVSGNTSGWRVLSKEGSGPTGTVTLISAGSPALGYYSSGSSASTTMVESLNSFSSNNFLNSSYASSARNTNQDDYNQMQTAGVVSMGGGYWLADRISYTTSTPTGTSYSGYYWCHYRYAGWPEGKTDWNYFGYKTMYTSYQDGSTYYLVKAIDSSGSQYTTNYSKVNSMGGWDFTDGFSFYYLYSGNSSTSPSGSVVLKSEAGDPRYYYASTATAEGRRNISFGIRPIITLKPGVKTDTTADTEFLGQICWDMGM